VAFNMMEHTSMGFFAGSPLTMTPRECGT